MDEAAYRQKFGEVVERPCAFEKAVLAACVACERSDRIQIAEREAVTCRNASSHSRCQALHDLLRHAFSFALGTLHDDTALPHAQEMRVQCGGLKGLQQVLNGSAEVANVDGLLGQAVLQCGELAEIPYSEVVHAAAQCYKGRHG
jgi:hypothetical protein